MDILNYRTSFFDIPKNGSRVVDFQSDLQSARRKIQDFVSASQASGYKIIGFIDKSISSQETLDKWYSRRQKELQSGVRYCVANMSLILGSIFQSLGVTVHYSNLDCDDTIAAFAYHLEGSVLSRDCDFFRYFVDYSTERVPPFKVFFNFSVLYGRLTLDRHGGPGRYRPRASPRQIQSSLPETSSSPYFLDKIPGFLRLGRTASNGSVMYQRGCGSNLTHEVNPHIQARALRQAVYQRMNYGPVLEIIAHWEERPTFTEDLVQPDDTLDHLLDSPREAFQHLFPTTTRSPGISEAEWRNHVFSQKCVVAELCAWTSPERGYLEILGEI